MGGGGHVIGLGGGGDVIGLGCEAGKRTALGLKLAHKKLAGDASHNDQCGPSIGGRTSRLTAAILTQPKGRHTALQRH